MSYTVGEGLYVAPYCVEAYIGRHVPKLNAPRFVILLTAESLVMRVFFEKQKIAFAGWLKFLKALGWETGSNC